VSPQASAAEPDLASLTTEDCRPELAGIDELPTGALVRLMSAEDAVAAAAVAACSGQITAVIDAVTARLRRGGRLIYVGAGTAGRIGALDASECPPTFSTPPGQVIAVVAGGQPALTGAVEGAEDDTGTGAADLAETRSAEADAVVGISASGRTPYVLGALRRARAVGALTVAVVSNEGSPMARAADLAIEMVTGPEVITGSTRLKAGTAQKLVLNMLSTIIMVRLGKTYGNLMVDLQPRNAKLRARARRVVCQATGQPDAQAAEALAADGDVKTAILMILTGASQPQARQALETAAGRLREAIESLRHP
jgi:N-acetylmuramic acid 6-phosphate etherase